MFVLHVIFRTPGVGSPEFDLHSVVGLHVAMAITHTQPWEGGLPDGPLGKDVLCGASVR